jgi:hypothetical protein
LPTGLPRMRFSKVLMRPDELPVGPRRDAVDAVIHEIAVRHELINLALDNGDYESVWAERQLQRRYEAELERLMTCHWHELGAVANVN